MSPLSFLNNFISLRNANNPQVAGGGNTFGVPFGYRDPDTFVQGIPGDRPGAEYAIPNIAPMPRGSYSPLIPAPEGSPWRDSGRMYMPHEAITSPSVYPRFFEPGDTTSPEVNIQFGTMTPEEYLYGNPRQMMPNGMGQMV